MLIEIHVINDRRVIITLHAVTAYFMYNNE